jgi:RNA polymerase sigma factor (sigma-70 family)
MTAIHDPEVWDDRSQAASMCLAILPALSGKAAGASAGMATDQLDVSPAPAEDAVATAYRAHYSLLEYIAVQKFRVPDADVRDVIHETVVAFIRHRERVYDEKAWLVGTMCNVSRLYWRRRAPDVADRESGFDEPSGVCAADEISQRVDVGTLLRRMPRRCREVLRLRFFEEYSSSEMAVHFHTTTDYARKMVYRCVSAARALLQVSRRSRR